MDTETPEPQGGSYLLRNGDTAIAYPIYPPLHGIWFFQGTHLHASGEATAELWGIDGNFRESVEQHSFDIVSGPFDQTKKLESPK
jgi:hypothetical protein